MSIEDFLHSLEIECQSLDAETREKLIDEWKRKWEQAKADGVSPEVFLANVSSVQEIVENYQTKDETNNSEVEFNPALNIISLQEEKKDDDIEQKEPEKKIKKKRTKGQKMAIVITFPLWFILLILILSLALFMTIGYIAFFVFGLFLFLYGLFTVAGAVFHCMVNLFGGIFQVGLGLVIISLFFWFIKLVNLLVKSLWKLFGRTIRFIGGR